ncbi:Ofcc1 [Phodopus roborovskii]|uniref:Ofcc1 protein n=1 Tax=Phodopus roborovskii TaxID=109678 RepID=A0AAU9ZPC4_PHORO|nr:Ofcc1 [Phodopus roborovskii]
MIKNKKFQQKAVKPTKQKKSTSAEFLMECTEAAEGAGNPGFNMSSPELLAHQTPKEKVIRHDMLGHTLAAHPQKSRLPASAGPKGVTSVLVMLMLASVCVCVCVCVCVHAWAEDQCCHCVQVLHSFVGYRCGTINSPFFGQMGWTSFGIPGY